MADQDRVDEAVVADLAELGEHAAAALQQQREVALTHEVAATGSTSILPCG
jgi:hypothetical protein